MVGAKFVFGVLICIGNAGLAFGQATGSLTGSVLDSSGAALANAKVSVMVRGGQQALMEARTNAAGLFSFIAVRPESYDLDVEAAGFAKHVEREVKVDALRETNVVIKMEIATAQQVIEVVADAQSVQLTNSEVSTTITRAQIQNLPTLARQVSALFATQAGVSSGRGPTVINGVRTSFANVTLDGVNVQDNFIRTNALDYMPYRTTIDQIAEVTIAVGNAGSTIGGGAAQISLTTRSGSNETHGAVYWYNRNNTVSANGWFNNRAGVPRPFLNLNQMGAAAGGRIIRDKLFYYGNYEAYRLRQQTSVLRTVLTPSAKTGVLGYRTGTTVNTANLLNLRQARIDSSIQALIDQLPAPNTTDAGDGLNTGGYRFNARSNNSRNQVVSRWDYYMNSNHSVTGSWNYTKEVTDRPTLGNFVTQVPPVFNDNNAYLLALAWRWTASPVLTNEVRGGFSLAPSKFNVRNEYPAFLLDTATANLAFSTPQNQFLRQGRDTNTYSIQDNANYLRGRHDFAFGFQSQMIRTRPFNDDGILPTMLLGISTANQTGFRAQDLPGIGANDLALANRLYANLAGIVSSARQTFNVKDRTSGYVANYPDVRNFRWNTYAGYLQDKWKATQRLTLIMGLRYEYWTPLDERDSLYLTPVLRNNNFIQTLMDPNATLDFAGGSVGRPYYGADKNNFAPNIGFAFDPTGKGKTAIRGGYMISYGNDEAITAIRNNIGTSAGLSSVRNVTNLVATLAARPTLATPAYKVPRTLADNYALSPTAATGMPDPTLRTPYVQQWHFSIQHEIKRNIIDLRYVGNRGTKLLRAIDYNQVVVKENGFLADFQRARSNAFLSVRATNSFNPAYDASIPGSQQLTVFPLLASGGLLTNATVQQNIRQGEVGTLADVYQTNGLNGSINFYRNPNILGANSVINGADSSYHALQLDWRRRATGSLDFQANYTFSKVLSNGIGDDQARFEPYLDLDSPTLERARAPFDLTHAIKANGTWELPFGRNKRFAMSGVADKVLGGWMVSGLMGYTSGTPFSIFSNRGTLNRFARTNGRNTATSLSTKPELDQRVGRLVMTGTGPYFVAPSALGTDQRGVASDGSAPFSGQLFFNPDPGSNGSLQRRMFSGPWNFSLDMSVLKSFRFRERHSVELRADAFSLPNNPSFWVGSETDANTRFDINQPTFGRIIGTFNSRRLFQFGLYYRF